MPITLEVTSEGQINLCKEVLDHLGVRPGDKLEVDLLKGRRIQVSSKRGTSAATIFGMLARQGTPHLSVEELNQIVASGWAVET